MRKDLKRKLNEIKKWLNDGDEEGLKRVIVEKILMSEQKN